MKNQLPVVKSFYFSNWGDVIGYRIAYALLPLVAAFPVITPNIVTLTGFCFYTLGSISLWFSYPYHLLVAAVYLPVGFILDDLDGQLARYTNRSSKIGDYLDKVLDIFKIFIISASLGYAVYLQSGSLISLMLGFAAAFFFMVRYYIKLEVMFASINHDSKYLEKSDKKKAELEHLYNSNIQKWKGSLSGFIKTLWLQHRIIFWVDEAEFALFTAVGALFDRLDISLYFIAGAQIAIAAWRFFERVYQINYAPEKLLEPLRK